MNTINDNDYDNPFIECEICETMVRFNDYNTHIEVCGRQQRQYIPPFMLPLFGRIPSSGEEHEHEHEEEQEHDEEYEEEQGDNNNDDAQVPQNDDAAANAFNLNLQYIIQIANRDRNEENAGLEENRENENREYDIENPPSEPLNYSFSLNLNFPFSGSNNPLQNLVSLNELNETQSQAEGVEQEIPNEETNAVAEDSDNSRRSFEELLQNIREGRVQVSDIANFILNETNSEELTPLLSRHVARQMNNGTEPRTFPAFTTMLPPISFVDDYEYNLMLANRLGKVERGVQNIDEVCKIITECDTSEICPICQETVGDIKKENISIRKTLCDHIFCDKCISTWLSKNIKCPVCNIDLEEHMNNKKYL